MKFPNAHHIIRGNVFPNFSACVGNTSLIKLRGPSELTGCNIYGKCEFENPGGSVKDRAAVNMVLQAERDGILVPGKPGYIVEGTAGNTGIGLTYAGNSRGYKTIIVIAETQTEEKKRTLEYAGAKLVQVPAVPYKNPANYVHVAKRLSQLLQRAHAHVFYADQWDNLANRRAHSSFTGPEIWEQLDGKVDAFSCAMGTGGTLAGVAEFLRSKSPNVRIALTDPCGAALHRHYTIGELRGEGDSITEGIGQGRLTGNMAGFRPDMSFEIPDPEALVVLYDLLEHEGLSLGGSSGINVAGAIRVAKQLGPGHNVVTILCDSGTRYASKLYNPTFLRARGLPVPSWLDDAPEPAETPWTKFRTQLPALVKEAIDAGRTIG